MHSPARTVEAGATLAVTYQLMQAEGIRHLPVLDGATLVGVVTDRDLRYATSALHPHPFPREARVERVMSPHPVTAAPLDPVEEAARLMRARKIGCLPVLDGDALVGIVTGTDLLDAIIHLTGLTKPSNRLAVRMDDEPGRLARLAALISERGVNIHSILSYPADDEHLQVILRVTTLNTHALAERLRAAGFTVLWPPA